MIQTDLLVYEFLRRSESTLQYKSKQPHAPLRSRTFGSSSIHLFPKSAVLLLVVLAEREFVGKIAVGDGGKAHRTGVPVEAVK